MMGKSKIMIVVGILLFSTILGFQMVEKVEAEETDGILIDDTYVDKKNPDSDYSIDADLGISNNSIVGVKHVYLKYDISEILTGSTINEANLQTYISYNTGVSSISLSQISNTSWIGSNVTWNNIPESTTTNFISTVDISSNPTGWVEWDVTDYIQDSLSEGIVSFKIFTENDAELYINSKENADNNPILNISYNPPPPFSANFTYDAEGLNVNFTDTSNPGPGNTITSWEWDFGDGNTSTMQNPNHIYQDDGEYNVTLNVTNIDDTIDEITYIINIENAAPVADFQCNPVCPTVDENFQLIDSSYDAECNIVNYTWDMKNGDIRYGENPEYNYSELGTYTIQLTIIDDKGLTDSIEKEIITKMEHTEVLEIGENNTYQNDTYNFNITIKNVTQQTELYLKKYAENSNLNDLGDRIYSAGFFMDVEVENWNAFVGPVTIKIFYTQNNLDNAGITEDGLDGIYYYNDTSETWAIYDDTGVVTDYNEDGYEGYCWATIDHLTPLVIAGEINLKPEIVNMIVIPNSIEEGGTVTFNGEGSDSDGEISAYKWESSIDGEIGDTQSFDRNDLSVGMHTISFSVMDNQGLWSDVDTAQLEVYRVVQDTPDESNNDFVMPGGGDENTDDVGAPVAEPGGPYEGIAGTLVYFDGSESTDDTGILSYQWDYGDGSDGYGKTPSHKYTSPGKYTVTLTVKDLDGKINTATTQVTITEAPNNPPEKPTIKGTKTGETETEYEYEIVGSDPDENKIKYYIDWGDQNTDTTDMVDSNSKQTISHSWIEPGLYHIKLYSEDEKNAVSETEEILVRIGIDVEFINGELNGFLIDYNKDGTYTKYYNNDTSEEINVEKQKQGTYLIDEDNDGNWDYTYSISNAALSSYEESGEENSGLEGTIGATTTDGGGGNTMVIVSAIALVVILGTVGFLGYRNQEYVKKYYNKADKKIHKTIKKLMKNKK